MRRARAARRAREFDARQILANWAGVDLSRINGLGLAAVMKILSEVGPDLSRFANVKHFCSWRACMPGTKISGGKVLSGKTKRAGNRVRQAPKMAAMSLSHSDSAPGAFYRRMSGRMDKPRAYTATAHKLARMVYFMLTRGEAYVLRTVCALRTAGPVAQRGLQGQWTWRARAACKRVASYAPRQGREHRRAVGAADRRTEASRPALRRLRHHADAPRVADGEGQECAASSPSADQCTRDQSKPGGMRPA